MPARRKQTRAARRIGSLFVVGVFALGLVIAGFVGVGWWRRHNSDIAPPDQRGWGHPGAPQSTDGEQFRVRNIVLIHAGGVRVRVHRRAAPLFRGFLDELAADGYAIRQADTGGYNHRFKRCADAASCEGQLSDHSWGTAVDVNWTTNALGTKTGCRMTTDLPADVGALAKRWGLRWGGNFSCHSKDPMHFEVVGRPEGVAAIVDANAVR